MKKTDRKIKAYRNGELVDKKSTEVRSDQRSKLIALTEKPPEVRVVSASEPAKLNTKEPEPVYAWKRKLDCDRCKRTSPTKQMYVFKNSSRGQIAVCDDCIEAVEKRSFNKLDALDKVRKEYKIDD